MKKSKFNLAFLTCLMLSSILFAQNKWSVEFRPGINFPSEKIEESKIETGFGFELTISYNFMAHLDAYLGWGYNNFSIEDSDIDFD